MKKTGVWYAGAFVIAIVAAGTVAASASQDGATFSPKKPAPQKVCPITFVLDPVTKLQTRFAADIEKTNAKLAEKLSDFRAALPGYVPGSAEMKLWLSGLSKTYGDLFADGYLKTPVLYDEGGIIHRGWYDILEYLSGVIPQTTFLHPQGVTVYLEHLGPENQTADYMRLKRIDLKGYAPPDVDFLAVIRTVLAYAPYDDPLLIGNETAIPHRKVCDPIY